MKCPKCELPVCSQRCSESPNHAVECALVAKAKAAGHEFSIGVPAVTPLRLCALKTTRPKDFETALSMEANLQVLRERPLWAHLQKHVVEPIMAMNMEERGLRCDEELPPLADAEDERAVDLEAAT